MNDIEPLIQIQEILVTISYSLSILLLRICNMEMNVVLYIMSIILDVIDGQN